MGRINLNIDDDIKRKLKSKLALEDRTVTAWFEDQAKTYLKKGGEVKTTKSKDGKMRQHFISRKKK